MKRSSLLAVAVMLVVVLPAGLRAAETQVWIHDGAADHATAETRGVVVRPEGVIALGPRAASTPAESLSVIWALQPLPDGSVAIAGDHGRIDRWTASGGIRPWVRLPVGQVLALAADGDGLVAGTAPEGRIYRVSARGDTALLAHTGERYVWGLASAGGGAWWVATGTRGRLLRVEKGSVRTVFDSEESHLVSLIADGKDGVFAGGDSRGRVYRVTGNGHVRTVFDAAEDEIRALALGADGALYAAALSGAAVALDREAEVDADEPTPAAAPVRAAISGGRAVVYRIVPDSLVSSVWTSPQPLVFALAAYRGALAEPGRDGILAATGNRAGLWLVRPGAGASQWLAMPQGQVTALAHDAKGQWFAATSNPGALWRLGPERADRGQLTSAVLDARRIAAFGRIGWQGSANGGKVTLETRSGNTDTPDTTWSGWVDVAAGGRMRSPAARYLQYRATLAGGDPRVDAVEAFYRERNLPPRVDEIVIAPQGTGFREGELQPRSEPVTQSLPGGQRVEYSFSMQPNRPLRGLPAFARGLRSLQWRGTDPNGDPLVFDIHARREDGADWTLLGEDYEANAFTWDTNSLPDGRYRVRIRASDANGNAVGEELTTEALTEPFTIDNTPPRVTGFAAEPGAGFVTLSGSGEDDGSVLWRIEVALDDGDWRTVSPEGGLSDDRRLSFRARLPDVTPGAHTVAVRFVDLAGNTAQRSIPVTVPARR